MTGGRPRARSWAAAVWAAALFLTALPASADEPSPTPSPEPSPAPSADPSAPPDPAADPPEDPERLAAEARAAEAARALAAAGSLIEQLGAMRRFASAELDALAARRDALRAEQLRLREVEEQTIRDIAAAEERLAQTLVLAYKIGRRSPLEVVLDGGSFVEALAQTDQLGWIAEERRRVIALLRELQAALQAARERLAAAEVEVIRTEAGLVRKTELIRRLEVRLGRLVSAAARGDELTLARVEGEVIDELATARSAGEDAMAEVAAAAAAALREELSSARVELAAGRDWVWPVAGRVTQEFGPSALRLEPPRSVGGVDYAHFHVGIDIAAPLLSTVHAAAAGRVRLVRHLSDGALVVIIDHGSGLTSLYGHLDDAVVLPLVREGDLVRAGDAIGAIGLTGITTGPHLHFAIYQEREPIDPRRLLPPFPTAPTGR